MNYSRCFENAQFNRNRFLFKQIIISFFALFIVHTAIAQLTAAMEKVQVSFMLDKNGLPAYSVSFDQKPIIKPSEMGFTLSNDDDFKNNFEITGSDKITVDETWKPVWG